MKQQNSSRKTHHNELGDVVFGGLCSLMFSEKVTSSSCQSILITGASKKKNLQPCVMFYFTVSLPANNFNEIKLGGIFFSNFK